ncbi:MAG TPA: P1 family peptidase [Candidatus Saccharimonadales bacterium]|jgi:L-aminopeptidase/D-esterase-like protein|nr:P1 family peptidase [Candidatus Saccharimonadales bacterium]
MQRREFNQSLLALALGAGSRVLDCNPNVKDLNASDLEWLGPGGLTDVVGIKVGHFTSAQRPTGCTVVLCEAGAVAGVDVRGSAPGTRETELLNPVNTVQQVQAIMLSGGSAFGLDTATGVMRYLEERGLGFKVGAAGVVPIVPAAILFDLEVGDPKLKIRPNAESGYKACVAASSGPVPQGNVGAGAGATVGKLFGQAFAMKSGVGTASARIGDTGIVVAALVAVNAVGDVISPKSGRIIAGARTPDGHGLRDSMKEIMHGYQVVTQAGANTTIGVIATNVGLEKVQMTKIAQMAHDGLARTINPVHTPFDGDTIFAVSTGTLKAKAGHGHIGAIAAEVMAQAVLRAVTQAHSIPGLPAYQTYGS